MRPLDPMRKALIISKKLFRIKPEAVACDLHPNYLATGYAQSVAQNEKLPLFTVQHHHAHLAACLADNHWNQNKKVIGIIFDGTGYGSDGAIWGGEILVGEEADFERAYHLKYIPLPGGDLAIRKPSRMALAYLWDAGLEWEPIFPSVNTLCPDERTLLHLQLEKRINAPNTSSMGRLFDAISALVGVRQEASYEAQAAIEFENLADPTEMGFYEFGLEGDIIHTKPLLFSLLKDWRKGISLPILSARFHNSVVNLCKDLCQRLRREQIIHTVALSGGVWQNSYLLERTIKELSTCGFEVLYHHQVPTNDGGISLGQAVVAAKRMMR